MNIQTVVPTKPTRRPQAPTVSVGMPVYNGEEFIREALDALLAQTFTDFELIISDNASTDQTEAICREYAAKDARIQYVRQQYNRGGAFNFKHVLDLSIGEYFMWAAYDDIREHEFIEKLLEGFVTSNVVSSFCISREIDEGGFVINERVNFDLMGKSSIARIWKYSIDYRPLRDMPIYGIHRKEVLDQNIKKLIKPWAWINKSNSVNGAHPKMYYLLASGQYYIYKEKVLFSRRVVSNQAWKSEIISRGEAMKKIAFIVLKFQLFFRSVNAVLMGSKSILVTLTTAPIVLYACMRPVMQKFLGPIYRLLLTKR